jgi:anti-sigma B factor antagonist
MRPGPPEPQNDAVCANATRRWYKNGVDQLKVSVSAEAAYSLVTLAGESDMNTRETLRDALAQAAAQPARHLIVDLSELEFIDSAAMHELMEARASFGGAGGQLALVAPQPLVARVLNLTGADQVVPVYPDLRSAVAAAS